MEVGDGKLTIVCPDCRITPDERHAIRTKRSRQCPGGGGSSVLQLFSGAFAIALNRALVRLPTPQTFGTATIQSELLLSTILFLSRKGVRSALLQSSV